MNTSTPNTTPAYPGWDGRQACTEGWDLWDVDGRIQLQRIDDPGSDPELGFTEPKFDSDADAIIHVAMHAALGSEYHREALELIGALSENLEPQPAAPDNVNANPNAKEYWFRPNMLWQRIPEVTYNELRRAGYGDDYLRVTTEDQT
jgi:hypothetical protein